MFEAFFGRLGRSLFGQKDTTTRFLFEKNKNNVSRKYVLLYRQNIRQVVWKCWVKRSDTFGFLFLLKKRTIFLKRTPVGWSFRRRFLKDRPTRLSVDRGPICGGRTDGDGSDYSKKAKRAKTSVTRWKGGVEVGEGSGST